MRVNVAFTPAEAAAAHAREARHGVEHALARAEADVLLESRRPGPAAEITL